MAMIIRSSRNSHVYYELDKFQTPIGEGGMGKVYKGAMVDEASGSSKSVAIKEIHIEGDSASQLMAVNRAREEASIRIKHDNVVEMIEFLEVSDTRFGGKRFKYYIVSEFLNCVSLGNLLLGKCENYAGQTISYARQLYEKYKQSPEEVSYLIVRNVIAGITAIHDYGYLHRDIDPSNVMVTDDGKIKLIDFGIAKKIEELQAGSNSVLEMGSFIGKVEYAAPELLEGKLQMQGPATDIYSIGVLFYALLAGHLPFTGTTYEIMQGHQHKRPPLGEVRNKHYRAVIGTALSKSPGARYSSASGLRAALESDAPVRQPSGLSEGAGRKIAVAVSSLAAAVAVVFTAIYFIRTPDPYKEGKRQLVHQTDTLIIEDIIDLSDYSPLPLESLWEKLSDEPDNSAVMYYISLKSNGTDLKRDMNAKAYYDRVLIAEHYTDRYLDDVSRKKGFSSQRFVFLIGCRAYEKAAGVKFSDSSFRDTIKHHLETVASGSTHFILNYE